MTVKMKNKKGMGIFFIIALVGVFIILSIFASYFGLTLLKKTIDEIGYPTIIATIAVALAIVFHGFVESVLMGVWAFVSSILKTIAK